MPRTAERKLPRKTARTLKQLIAERESSRGLLIAFEGADGSGKTTQRKLLAKWLESRGQEVLSTRWASSPLVKPLLKTRKRIRSLSTEEYSLLHAVDVRHRLETSILPALWAGKTVLADRYLFTALARDAARGLELDWLLHAYSPLLWPDLVVYFSMTPEDSQRRIASTRSPHFYEAGQDVTGLDDPLASYGRFIDRVVTEYENLAVIFKFVTVDASDAVYRQHMQVRELVEAAEKRPWPVFSKDAVEEWLRQSKTSPA
jgi:dTMP kinase